MNRREFLKKGLEGIVLASAPTVFAKTPEGIHYISWIYERSNSGFREEDVKFRNVPPDLPFIKSFPMDNLLKYPSVKNIEFYDHKSHPKYIVEFDFEEGKTDTLEFIYNIYTSVSDAEESLAEKLFMTSYGFFNAIDIGKEGEIGDNCWYYVDFTKIWFIRNNVRVEIYGKYPEYISKFAKLLDGLLIDSEKVSDAGLIHAPVINSVTVVSITPRKDGEMINLQVDAYDPNGQKLKYRVMGNPGGSTSYDGIVFFKISDRLKAKSLKIWITNEDFIVLSHDYFLEPLAVEDEGAAAESQQVFELFQNQPNPFNPATAIRYVVYEPGLVSLRIYDPLGCEVTVLVEEYQETGNYHVFWQGTDNKGSRVSSGIYLYRLRAGGKEETKRMTLVR